MNKMMKFEESERVKNFLVNISKDMNYPVSERTIDEVAKVLCHVADQYNKIIKDTGENDAEEFIAAYLGAYALMLHDKDKSVIYLKAKGVE